MTRYVLDPGAALLLARARVDVDPAHKLVAPALQKSQVLSALYLAVQRDELTKKDADAQLNYLRELHIRYLSDRVSQATAWRIAAELGLPDTLGAEYIAVTTLQADALVTADDDLARVAREVVEVVTVDALIRPA